VPPAMTAGNGAAKTDSLITDLLVTGWRPHQRQWS
jgi:hypothetical protein